MFRKIGVSSVITVVVVLATSPTCFAQQVQVTNPYHTINDSFYENFGIGWNVDRRGPRGDGWFFNWGPAGMAPPPFGGYDPAADARFGASVNGFNFNFLAGQGSSRSHVMEAPTVVIPNGGSGGIFSGSQRPFVTGIIPVVGNGIPNVPVPMMAPRQPSTSPLRQAIARMQQEQQRAQQSSQLQAQLGQQPLARPADRMAQGANQGRVALPQGDDAPLVLGGNRSVPVATKRTVSGSSSDSSANHGDISVAEIKRQQALKEAQIDEEIRVRIEKARGHEDAGNTGVAKIYYQQAANRADGPLKQSLLKKIRSLSE